MSLRWMTREACPMNSLVWLWSVGVPGTNPSCGYHSVLPAGGQRLGEGSPEKVFRGPSLCPPPMPAPSHRMPGLHCSMKPLLMRSPLYILLWRSQGCVSCGRGHCPLLLISFFPTTAERHLGAFLVCVLSPCTSNGLRGSQAPGSGSHCCVAVLLTPTHVHLGPQEGKAAESPASWGPVAAALSQ